MRQSLVIAKSLYGKDRPLYADHLWTVRYNFDLRFKLITSGLKVIAVIVIHFQNEVQFDCIQDSLYCQQILFVHMLYSPLNSYMIALSELYNEVFRLKQCCWLLLLVMQHSCKRNFLFFIFWLHLSNSIPLVPEMYQHLTADASSFESHK